MPKLRRRQISTRFLSTFPSFKKQSNSRKLRLDLNHPLARMMSVATKSTTGSTLIFAPLKYFNMTVWLVIISTLIGRFATFMVWPFLAIILHQKFNLNELEIGAFIAFPIFIGVITGFFLGYLSDRVGRRKIILIGLALSIASLLTMAFADDLNFLMLGMLGQAITRGMIENPGRALMTDMLVDRDAKDLSLQVRYFALNIGAAFGPLVGINIGLTGQQTTFALVALVYAIYMLAALVVFKIQLPLKHTKMSTNQSIGEVVNVLRADHAFLLFVFASLFAFTAYGQIDAGLLQYLRVAGFAEITKFYAMLILINGTTIIIFQFPILKLMTNIVPLHRAGIGVLTFIIAFITFAFSPTDTQLGLMVAMFLLSLGEVIMFPTLSIIVDRMAPDHLKGSYFGAASLGAFGFAFAPLLGGFLLHQFGGITLWIFMACLSALIGGLFFLAEKTRNNHS